MRQWIGEGVRLQLEADLYDIERSDYESTSQELVYHASNAVKPFTLLSTQLQLQQ
jgi:hypothetical protein